VMLMVFFDSEGVVHYEFLPQARTVNKEYYLEVMQRLREAVRKKRPDAWQENRWMLQHDNAPSHSLFLIRDFLAKHATTSFHSLRTLQISHQLTSFCYQSSNQH
jgi:hypothetical protein